MKTIDLSGIWECSIPEEVKRLGFWQEGDPIVTRLTRKKVFEGQARFSKKFCWDKPEGCRIFLECERTRHLQLAVNGQEARAVQPATLSAPAVFEITGLASGQDEFVLLSDNSYPGWPRDAIVYASAASDETQTNWNGILGYIRLRIEKPDYISGIRVYPVDGRAEIRVDLDLSGVQKNVLRISSPALLDEPEIPVPEKTGPCEVRCSAALRPDVRLWDLEEGNLYPLTVSAENMESRTVHFGVRDFAARNGHLALNGRRIFLRGETNCAAFPETGYIPADPAEWTEILERYRAYGVNCVRFHSHCPPEAAFTAADRIGMLMQPELSHWDPEHAFASENARGYYAAEARQILRHLANHPSFVMLSFGNELHFSNEQHAFTDCLLRNLRTEDPTRLYVSGSNAFYGSKGPDPSDDFYTSCKDRKQMLRATSANFSGWLNRPSGIIQRKWKISGPFQTSPFSPLRWDSTKFSRISGRSGITAA